MRVATFRNCKNKPTSAAMINDKHHPSMLGVIEIWWWVQTYKMTIFGRINIHYPDIVTIRVPGFWFINFILRRGLVAMEPCSKALLVDDNFGGYTTKDFREYQYPYSATSFMNDRELWTLNIKKQMGLLGMIGNRHSSCVVQFLSNEDGSDGCWPFGCHAIFGAPEDTVSPTPARFIKKLNSTEIKEGMAIYQAGFIHP